jgi:hypothetical protein
MIIINKVPLDDSVNILCWKWYVVRTRHCYNAVRSFLTGWLLPMNNSVPAFFYLNTSHIDTTYICLSSQWNRDNAMFNKGSLVHFQIVYMKQFLLAWLTTWLKDRLVCVNCRTITFPLYIIYIAEIVRKLVSSIPVSCRNRSYLMQIECENKMLKWYLFCPKREEVTGGWIKLNALFVSC